MAVNVALSGSFSADGNSSAVTARTEGYLYVIASGTFGGGTVTAQVTYNDSTYVSAGTDATITSAGNFRVAVPKGAKLRLNLTGSAGPSINYWIA